MSPGQEFIHEQISFLIPLRHASPLKKNLNNYPVVKINKQSQPVIATMRTHVALLTKPSDTMYGCHEVTRKPKRIICLLMYLRMSVKVHRTVA